MWGWTVWVCAWEVSCPLGCGPIPGVHWRHLLLVWGWSSLPFASFLTTGSLTRRQDSQGHIPLVDCLPSWCLKTDKWLTPWNSRLDPSYSHEFSLGSHRLKLFFQHFTQPGVPAGLYPGNSPRGELGAQGAWEVKGGGTRAVGEAGDWAAPR